MENNLLIKLLLSIFLVLNTGCLGSSGGSGNSNNGNNTPPTNPTPLNVISAKINTMSGLVDLSESGSVNDIDIQANLVNIELRFNKDIGSLIKNSMDPSADDIHLSYMGSSGAEAASLNIVQSGSLITLSPKLDLRPLTQYTLVVKSDIAAADGSTMNSGKNYRFITKDTEPSEIDQYIVFKWVPAGEDVDDNPITEDGFGFFAEEVPDNVLPKDVYMSKADSYLLKDVSMQVAVGNPDNLQLDPGQLGRRIHYRDFNFGTEADPIYMEYGKPYVFRLTAYLWTNSFQTSKNESVLSESFKVIEL